MGAAEDQRQGQQGEDRPVDGVAAHHQGQGILQEPPHRAGKPEQGIQPRQQGGFVPAEVKDQHQDDAVVVIVKASEGQHQNPPARRATSAGWSAPHGQQAEEEGEEDVPVGQVAQDIVGVEGQNPEGLGHHGEIASRPR